MANKVQYGLFQEHTDIKPLMRDSWEEAAQDAVNCQVGRWTNKNEFTLDWPFVIKAVRAE